MRTLKVWLLTMLFCGLAVRPAYADVPHLIRYQGQVVDAKHVPLDGPYTLTFRLYDKETAGNKTWEEVQKDVPIKSGSFSVLLGQVTSLATVDWSKPLWLAVQIGQEPELMPRQQITSVPLAIMAEQLAGPITTVGNNVGIGTTSPGAKLDVQGGNINTSGKVNEGGNAVLPAGAIILWTGGSCPAGYTRLTTLDGKFLVSGTTYNPAAGGSNTHDHGGISSTSEYWRYG